MRTVGPAWLDGASSFDGASIRPYIRKFGVWGPIDETKEDTGDWRTAQYCADFLAKDHGRPFFLACGIFRPHSPQLAPQELFDLYNIEDIQFPNGRRATMWRTCRRPRARTS